MSSDSSCSAEALIALMQAGDMVALDRLARAYGARLLAVARKQCHAAADAEDAVQQALLMASSAMTGIRGEGSPVAWLSTLVVRNCARFNRLASASEELGEVPCPCADGERVAEQQELARVLSEALMNVPRTDRLLFLLSAEGHTSVELAEEFGLSHDAVRSRLKRVRKQLRVALERVDTLISVSSTEGLNPDPGVTR